MQREHRLQGTAKTMLYSYRVALTGICLLETGEVVGDVRALAPRYGFEVTELVAFKANGREKVALDADLDARSRAEWPRLSERLEAALEGSELPDESPNRSAFDAWLIACRRAAL